MIIAVAVIVIACAVLVSTTLGVILGAIAIAFGLWHAVRWLIQMLGEPDEDDSSGPGA